jgi:DNA-binding transcriptional regulator YbjK
MSAEFQSIDEVINASYQSASQVETMARQLEARISKIDGAKGYLPHRNYGQPVNLAKIRSNLTLTALITKDSAELAHYCRIDP